MHVVGGWKSDDGKVEDKLWKGKQEEEEGTEECHERKEEGEEGMATEVAGPVGRRDRPTEASGVSKT